MISFSFRLFGEHTMSFRLLSARQNQPLHPANGTILLHSTNGRKQKSRQKALKSRPFDG